VRVLEGLKSQVLIGRAFWIKNKLKLDLTRGQGTINALGRSFSGPVYYPQDLGYLPSYESEEVQAVEEEVDIDDKIKTMGLSEFSPDVSLQERLRDILWKKRNIFKGVGAIKGVTHKIKLKPEAEPVFLPMRRRSPAEKKTEEDSVRKLLDMGVLEPSVSLWGTSNVFVPKNGKDVMRTTSDFRRLNDMTVTDVYPIEDMKATLEWLASKNIYSVFDLKDGFYQIVLDEE